MIQLHPIDGLDFVEMQEIVESLQESAKKQTSGSSKLTLIAAAAAVGGVAYFLSPAGKRQIRNIRTKVAELIHPESPLPMWADEAKAAVRAVKKEPKKAPTPVAETEI